MELASEYGFKLTTSNPHFPRSHNFIEKLACTTENLLNNCTEDGSDPELGFSASESYTT